MPKANVFKVSCVCTSCSKEIKVEITVKNHGVFGQGHLPNRHVQSASNQCNERITLILCGACIVHNLHCIASML